MKLPSFPGFTVGIIGGGQLGRMMALEARRMGIRVVCLDPAQRPPALGIADECIVGSLYDPEKIRQLASKCDVLTFEIEHIGVEVLHELEAEGVSIFPRPATLATIQDKFLQKSRLAEAGLPVPHIFAALDGRPDAAPKYPVVQKARRNGYDGRGVKVLRSPADLTSALSEPSYFEDCVAFEKELAVLLARDAKGNVATWDLIEMVFDPETQICNSVLAPARVPGEPARRALELGAAAVEALDGVGVFAVELFLTADGEILVNEIAPRPHNSGHWTIEGAVTSQFEQHLRAVCGLPLGNPGLLAPACMHNILGSAGATGTPLIRGYSEALAIPGLSVHWYEKAEVSTQRKMGHFTVVAADVATAEKLAAKAADLLVVEGRG